MVRWGTEPVWQHLVSPLRPASPLYRRTASVWMSPRYRWMPHAIPFYRIYDGDNGRPDLIDNILKQLDFHPLSVTLLATVAHQISGREPTGQGVEATSNGCTSDGTQQSLAAAIELFARLPMFRELGPDARGLLESSPLPAGCRREHLDWPVPYHLGTTNTSLTSSASFPDTPK